MPEHVPTPPPAAEWAPLSSLKPWHRNPRVNAKAVEAVARAIIAYGWGAPLVARKADRVIIAGHTRRLAALKLAEWGEGKNLETWHSDARVVACNGLVPVRFLDCDESTAERLALADNRLGEIADWDDSALLDILKEYDDATASVLGWNGAELDDLIDRVNANVKAAEATTTVREHERKTGKTGREETQEREPEDDVADPADGAAFDVRPGDVWTLRAHRLMCGDSTDRGDVARLMGGHLADMVWSDPPYGVNVSGKGGRSISGDLGNTAIAGFFPVALEALKEGRGIYVCGGSTNVPLYFKLFELHTRNLPKLIVWVKNGLTLRHYDYHSRCEFVYYGWKQGEGTRPEDRWFGDRKQDDVWEIKRDATSTYIHPTQKPVALPWRAVVNSTPEGGLVFDPFAGSGSSLIACEEAHRVCFTMEIDPACAAAVLARYAKRYGEAPVLVERVT